MVSVFFFVVFFFTSTYIYLSRLFQKDKSLSTTAPYIQELDYTSLLGNYVHLNSNEDVSFCHLLLLQCASLLLPEAEKMKILKNFYLVPGESRT